MADLRPMPPSKSFDEILEEAPELDADKLIEDLREIYGEIPPGLEQFIRGEE